MKLTEYLKEDCYFLIGLTLSLIAETSIGIHACLEVYNGRGSEPFSLGFVDIPKFIGANANNWSVAILMTGILVAIIVGYIMRYRYYRDELHLLKKAGLDKRQSGFYRDFDSDGSGGDDF
jgi:hypothetical protein